VKGAGASGWWGDADAQALAARGAVERRAHGKAEDAARQRRRAAALGFWGGYGVGDEIQGVGDPICGAMGQPRRAGRHEGSPEISGGRCAAGRGRRKKGPTDGAG
jgi:hypothetical protein